MTNANGWNANAAGQSASGQTMGQSIPGPTAVYPLAPLPASALQGVRTRRVVAVMLDLILVTLLSMTIFMLLGFLTLGLAWIILPPIFPLVAFFYNGLTISGWRMATPGMKAMDLEMRLVDGSPTPFLHAAVHAVLFYVSWMFPPILLFSLLSADKRCLHDILAGVIVLRRV
jgi:uncharacterized RDD family membrane protein YckC